MTGLFFTYALRILGILGIVFFAILNHMKFIVDRTLGKLAERLRALGFDTLYWEAGKLDEAVRLAAAEGRVLLTRSRRMSREKGGRVLVVEQDDPSRQLPEVLSRLGLKVEGARCFTRCLRCNAVLRNVPKGEVEGKVPDFIFRTYDSFHSCPRCGRIYWPGTHLERMKGHLAKVMADCG